MRAKSACQAVAGMLVGEKNRCILENAPDVQPPPFRNELGALAGTIAGTILSSLENQSCSRLWVSWPGATLTYEAVKHPLVLRRRWQCN